MLYLFPSHWPYAKNNGFLGEGKAIDERSMNYEIGHGESCLLIRITHIGLLVEADISICSGRPLTFYAIFVTIV